MLPDHRPLTAEDLLPHGPLRRLGRQVYVQATVDSTNAFLLERAGQLEDGALACAEFQSAGRGRLGRRWEAPRGAAVLLSVLLHEPADAPVLTRGAMLGCVAACEAVEAATDCTPTIRWPNDIALGAGKLGGVLTETRVCDGGRAVVIGIGLNCLQQAGHFKGDLAAKAVPLDMVSTQPVSRAAAARGLVAALDRWLSRVAEAPEGWAALAGAWRRRCDDFGQRVTLEHDGRVIAGTALEVTADGELVVQPEQGRRRSFSAATTTRVW
jgi:BirA family transcriptional regulator, biotin operon repressor / biotin---[acetyl-CoA-carboxylase] ligase